MEKAGIRMPARKRFDKRLFFRFGLFACLGLRSS